MRRFSSRLTRGRRSTPRTTLKMAALAPMPRARVRMTVMARPLVRARERRATFRSRMRTSNFSIVVRPPGYFGYVGCRELLFDGAMNAGFYTTGVRFVCSVSLEAREVPCGSLVRDGLSVVWGETGAPWVGECSVLG